MSAGVMPSISASDSWLELIWWHNGQPMSHGRAPFRTRRTKLSPCFEQTSSVRTANPHCAMGRPMLNVQSGYREQPMNWEFPRMCLMASVPPQAGHFPRFISSAVRLRISSPITCSFASSWSKAA